MTFYKIKKENTKHIYVYSQKIPKYECKIVKVLHFMVHQLWCYYSSVVPPLYVNIYEDANFYDLQQLSFLE